ncbi:hypothetical protein ONS95_010877 [Cadophora gregata]|uniref:uncharacterized protein n=1 Tax=Cadophora gregata TaxID=51156 RepID=UPI0026DD8940|nr:uncharacterized protein ONS95_010877 [Cadophora gregata]KAK0119425.1 hypothetical protein ONS95_010877 [Cadophora gregata]
MIIIPQATIDRSISQDASSQTPKLHGIKSNLLIPGRGSPIKNGTLIIHEKSIVWVGPHTSLPAKYSAVPFTHVDTLLPGLWDCHVHFLGVSSLSSFTSLISQSAVLSAARIVKDLERTLMAGFTSVRELAGYAGEMSPAIEEDSIVGPNVYSSIGILSMTAGHGDIHDLPIETVLDACAKRGIPFAVCDGVPDCIRTVRKMIRRGAKVIKVCATGGVYSLIDDPEAAEFSPDELKAIVEEAARAKRVVAAHCHGKDGIINALNAGVRTIEHGSFLDEECVKLMKEKNAILVATSLVVEGGMENLDDLPPINRAKMIATAAVHRKAYKLAVKSGVRISLGTDQGTSLGDTYNTHGRNGKELFYAVEAGMSPLQAIEAATAMGPETLGDNFAKTSGLLKEGFDADVIAIAGNPLDDIKLFADAKNITHVWKAGKKFKSPA